MKRAKEWFTKNFEWLWFLTPMLGWMGVCGYVGRLVGIPWWATLIVSVVVGALLHFGNGALHGGNTAFEMGCGSTIGLVLALLVIPIFQQARQKAQMTECKKNLTQLAAGFARYKAAHDGQLPPEKSWEAALATYVPVKAFVCPASKHSYRYEAGRNRRILTEVPQCHGEWSMTLFTEGRVKALKLSLPPTPGPALLARQ